MIYTSSYFFSFLWYFLFFLFSFLCKTVIKGKNVEKQSFSRVLSVIPSFQVQTTKNEGKRGSVMKRKESKTKKLTVE